MTLGNGVVSALTHPSICTTAWDDGQESFVEGRCLPFVRVYGVASFISSTQGQKIATPQQKFNCRFN
jgi:hypothetical protein